jgi:tol-pal system protein YbgF
MIALIYGLRGGQRPAPAILRAAVVSAWLGLVGVSAQAALFGDDEARKAIVELRQRVEAVESQSQARSAELAAQLVEQLGQFKRNLLDVNAQLDQLRQELAQLRGQNEQASKEIADLRIKLKDTQAGVSDKLKRFEPVKVTVDGVEFYADPDEKRAYDEALAFLRQEDFGGAITALQGFQRRFPSSGYTDSVNFWLGTALHQRQQYRDAIAALKVFIAAAPASPKAPEALLTLSLCQAEVKDAKGARKSLEDIVKNYPKSEAAGLARSRLAGRK